MGHLEFVRGAGIEADLAWLGVPRCIEPDPEAGPRTSGALRPVSTSKSPVLVPLALVGAKVGRVISNKLGAWEALSSTVGRAVSAVIQIRMVHYFTLSGTMYETIATETALLNWG